MGKKGNKKEKGFSLRFAEDTSPSTSVGFNASVQLERMFPALDKTIIREVLAACRQDIENAANMLIEMGLVQQFGGPSLSLSQPMNSQITPKNANFVERGSHDSAKSTDRQSESAIQSLPADMLLKLFGYFRTVDLMMCSRCCRQWSTLCLQILETVPRLDITHPSNRYNLALMASCPRVASIKVYSAIFLCNIFRAFVSASIAQVRGAFDAFPAIALQRCAATTLAHIQLVTCSGTYPRTHAPTSPLVRSTLDDALVSPSVQACATSTSCRC
jgi:hypothetical protein